MQPKLFLLAAAVATLSACSGGGGSAANLGGLQLTQLSVQPGQIWQINREIEFSFNEPIDFRTVSFNTISIQTPAGEPANGTFSVKMLDTDGDGIAETPDPRTVVFQPTCPTKSDLSDAGLKIDPDFGSVQYEIVVAGKSSGAQSTVRSAAGQGLQTTQRRTFMTPASQAPNVAFLDTVNGPPQPVIRTVGSTEQAASYVEIGGDDQNRIYYEFDPATQTFTTSVPGFEVPLNLYSDADSAVAVLLHFNQPVNPDASNINPRRLRLEFQDGTGAWQPIKTQVSLVQNCTDTGGAIVRLEPLGILPAGSTFRAAILPGFQDISGETNLLAITNFSDVPTETVQFNSLSPAEDKADELLEEFLVGGNDPRSFEDTNVLFDTSTADWENGGLTSGFRFEGTGGPGGDFDVIIPAGATVQFDTTSTQISGGPGGIPTTSVTAVGGVLDVRDFTIETGAIFSIVGPNPFRLNASGTVTIRGTIDASGLSAKDVGTLNTGNQAEIGGTGVAGGGNGGDASTVLNNSTPRGGTGRGAFGLGSGGGQGGESGYAEKSQGKNARRPGGGGGGALSGPIDRIDNGSVVLTFFGTDGNDGHSSSRGAETNMSPAQGGALGPTAFVDGDPSNDFFGVRPMVDPVTSAVTLIQGELSRQLAGTGGGGGGDAIPANQFPHPNWSISTDEKGGGGGGGGGAINIRALGMIVFGANGQIRADGGGGAKGENTLFLDHVGGSGGGGSAGHIIVESATGIDFTDGGTNDLLSFTKPNSLAFLRAVGGKGGDGFGGPKWSRGGRGSSGPIQLHVPSATVKPERHPAAGGPGTADIFVPLSASLEPDPLMWVADPPTFAMIPSFGARSKARSKWISIGGADQDPGGGVDQLLFLFDGTDPATGAVKTVPGQDVVAELAPILGGGSGDVVKPGNDATVRAGGAFLDVVNTNSTLDVLINDTGTPSKDVYLRTPDLLRNFVLRLSQASIPSNFQDFVITDATYDDSAVMLSMQVDVSGGTTLEDFIAGVSGDVIFAVIPRFFSIRSAGTENVLSQNARVKILFEATGADSFGDPIESPSILVPLTSDISQLNAQPPGAIQFFRFQVEFDLDAMGAGLTTATDPVTIDFLRMPFRF